MRHLSREVVPVRRRRLGFAFGLFAALVSGGWDDCCCYGPPRLAEPAGWGPRKQPFADSAYYLFPYDGGPSVGTRVGAKGWDPSLRVSASWSRLGRISYDGKPAYVTSIARENDEYQYVGSNLGLLGVNTFTGSVRQFSGLPSNAGIWNVLKRPPGGVYAGLYNASAAGIPLFYQCQLAGATCTAVPGGPVSTKPGDGSWAIHSFGGATYLLSTVGMSSSPNYGMFFKEGTPSASNYDMAGEDGTHVVTSDSGVYKGAGRGGAWTLDNMGLGTACAGATFISPRFYVVCNNPSLQVYRRGKTDPSWTTTNLNVAGNGFGLEADGSDVVLGTTVGPYRYNGTTWAPDDDCYKSPSQVYSVRLDGQTLAAGGPLTGYSESTDGGATWAVDSSSVRLSARYIAKNSFGTYFASGSGQHYRPAGGSAFQAFTIPGGNASALGTAGNTVIAGLPSGGVGTLNGTTFQAANTSFDTSAYVNGFASNGTGVVVLTNKGSWFSPSLSLSWTKGANRSDGQPFVGYCGTPLSNGDYLLGGYLNPSGGNIQRSNAAGTSLTAAGAGIPTAATVWDLKEISNGSFVRAERNAQAAGNPTALVAATSLGLYASFDGAASWSLLSKELGASSVNGLAIEPTRLWVATSSRGLRSFALPLRFPRLVPIVLDVTTATAHYTTELAITNPGTTTANVTVQYTAAIGSGSFTFSDIVDPGQRVIPDVIAYLRTKGAPIPGSGSQGGTLLLTFTNVSGAGAPAVTARTTAATGAPLPVGSAGLAYGALDPDEGSRGTLTVYGLRSNATDRSNFAVYNTSDEDVTFSVTAYSGSGSGASSVVATADTLPAWGWKQYNGVLDGPGYAQGWVSVTRTSTTGSFGVYGVVNDNKTNDGSLLGPGASPQMPIYTNVPVLVETGAFVSELDLANPSASAVTFRLTYRESLAGSGGGSTDVVVAAKTQLIVPSAIAYLRTHGVSIGAAGGSFAGSLHVEVVAGNAAGTWVGARTSAPTPSGGQFGLFTPATGPGGEGAAEASVFGLRSDAENRTNVALVHTGDTDDGSITLSVQAYDGNASGAPRGAPTVVVLAPGQWQQLNNFLATPGVANGWVKVTRTAGFAPWIAYGVVNDGGAPGQRTSDGAYVAMTR